MTGSWGQSLMDRCHTDCTCRFQKPSLYLATLRLRTWTVWLRV
jgi:hypothetical protein